jgi:hypothetical protein
MNSEIGIGRSFPLGATIVEGGANFSLFSRRATGSRSTKKGFHGTARSTVEGAPLSSDELRKIDAYWRASLYLCMGMLYLKDNPLLGSLWNWSTRSRGSSVIGAPMPASASPTFTLTG